MSRYLRAAGMVAAIFTGLLPLLVLIIAVPMLVFSPTVGAAVTIAFGVLGLIYLIAQDL